MAKMTFQKLDLNKDAVGEPLEVQFTDGVRPEQRRALPRS